MRALLRRHTLVALAVAAACAPAAHSTGLLIVSGPSSPAGGTLDDTFGDGGLAGCYHAAAGPTIEGHVSMNMNPGDVVPGSYRCSTICGITTCVEERCFAGLPGSVFPVIVSVTGSDTRTDFGAAGPYL